MERKITIYNSEKAFNGDEILIVNKNEKINKIFSIGEIEITKEQLEKLNIELKKGNSILIPIDVDSLIIKLQ